MLISYYHTLHKGPTLPSIEKIITLMQQSNQGFFYDQ